MGTKNPKMIPIQVAIADNCLEANRMNKQRMVSRMSEQCRVRSQSVQCQHRHQSSRCGVDLFYHKSYNVALFTAFLLSALC
jgi:hypothetical protein